MIRMMENDQGFIGPVNLGNPVENTILEFAEKIITITGSKSKIITNRCPRMIPNNADRISPWRRRETGLAADRRPGNGLKATADYFAARCNRGNMTGMRITRRTWLIPGSLPRLYPVFHGIW
jgi:UDP-glucuronate decarboxylase